MVYILGFCVGNVNAAVAEYQRRYPNRRIPSSKTFSGTYRTLLETGTLPSIRILSDRHRDAQEEENILQSVERSPRSSTRRLATRLNVSQSKVCRILHENGLYPFHVQKVHHSEPHDCANRVHFCKWLNGNRQLYRVIMFSDEATFTRDGINNMHNMHIWADENPHATVESHFQHRFSVNVWCGVVCDQLLGPFIFPGNLNGQMYGNFLLQELPQLLDDVPLETRRQMYIQHDGAPAHFHRVVTAHLNQQFPHRWIGRGGPINWPARSPDLTPLDYCIWGWMKDIVYQVRVQTRDELIQRIFDAATSIRNEHVKLRNATRAVHTRANLCLQMQGGNFEHLL